MSAGRRSAWLGLSQTLEVGLQALLAVLLVRHLTAVDFADYRLAWLIAGGAAALLPFAIPDVLSLLLPVKPAADRAAHVRVAFIALGGAGLAAAVVTWFGAGLSDAHAGLRANALACAFLVGLSVPAVLLDYLPLADERGDWQARVSIVLALLRTALAAWAVLAWEQLGAVLWTVAAVAASRVALVALYGQRRHHWLGARSAAAHWRAHFALAAPLGISGLFFTLRRQADQWIAAAAFAPVQFAAFSLGAVASPLVLLVRRAVSLTLLPAMARQHAQGDWGAVLDTNHRANTAVACLAFALLAFLGCFGEPIYDLVYTSRYREAVPVMRLMALGWALQVIELNSLVQFAGLMPRVARLQLVMLGISLAGAAAGGFVFGLPGLAAGGVLAIAAERAVMVRWLSAQLARPAAEIQPWRRLAALAASCLAIGLCGRLLFELLPAGWPSWLRLAAAAPPMLVAYVLLVRGRGWWPERLVPVESGSGDGRNP
ncbi:MAG: lipopolysaccharide biosynthesis protein [Rubrivivax sp.]